MGALSSLRTGLVTGRPSDARVGLPANPLTSGWGWGCRLSAEKLFSTEIQDGINALPGWWRRPHARVIPPASTGTQGTEAPALTQPSSPSGWPSVHYQALHDKLANVSPSPVSHSHTVMGPQEGPSTHGQPVRSTGSCRFVASEEGWSSGTEPLPVGSDAVPGGQGWN